MHIISNNIRIYFVRPKQLNIFDFTNFRFAFAFVKAFSKKYC